MGPWNMALLVAVGFCIKACSFVCLCFNMCKLKDPYSSAFWTVGNLCRPTLKADNAFLVSFSWILLPRKRARGSETPSCRERSKVFCSNLSSPMPAGPLENCWSVPTVVRDRECLLTFQDQHFPTSHTDCLKRHAYFSHSTLSLVFWWHENKQPKPAIPVHVL